MLLRLALVQLKVGSEKAANLARAVSFIQQAKQQGADLVTLPEFFNCPYGISTVSQYAETIPNGETSAFLSDAAKKHQIYIIGGTFPEKDGEKFYNTSTVWNPNGDLIAKHRKVHLFDIDIKGKITFQESKVLSGGDSLTTFDVKGCKIGLGICYDIRFEEMARIYRNMGCELLVYPAAFNTKTGPLHWTLLQRGRANDNQLYVACVSPARSPEAGYIAYGHTQLTDPWGKVLHEMDENENMFVSDIDLDLVKEVRAQIPTFNQRRLDLYETTYKKQN